MKIIYYFLIAIILLIIIKYLGKYYDLYFLKQKGYIVKSNFITSDEIDELKKVIYDELKNKNKEFSIVREPENRKHIMLPLNRITKNCIYQVYHKLNFIWKNLVPDTILAECASFISHPGAKKQSWHADVDQNPNFSNIFSIGIALTDITEDMGPLELYPESHNLDVKKFNKMNIDTNKKYYNNFPSLDDVKPKKIIISKGSLVIWNGRIIHRASENKSKLDRVVFYFTFIGNDKNKPVGSTYSLKKKYGEIKLNDLVINIGK